MANQDTNNDTCCPEFDPTPWNEKLLEWNNKKFIKGSVLTFFYIPVNFGSVMRRLNRKVEEQKATVPGSMSLSDHTSMWNMDLYLAADTDIMGAENVTLSGTYATKVYEGPYSETGNWNKDFKAWCSSRGLNPQKNFLWYTTCPKCAKKYGKNYVVFFAKVKKQ